LDIGYLSTLTKNISIRKF